MAELQWLRTGPDARFPLPLFEPGLHRVRAELLAGRAAEPARVEASFRTALDLARARAARSLELRTATSCARWGSRPPAG